MAADSAGDVEWLAAMRIGMRERMRDSAPCDRLGSPNGWKRPIAACGAGGAMVYNQYII